MSDFNPHQRLSDAERSKAVHDLQTHAAAGRLNRQELVERVQLADQAKVGADLAPLFADLPGLNEQLTAPTADQQSWLNKQVQVYQPAQMPTSPTRHPEWSRRFAAAAVGLFSFALVLAVLPAVTGGSTMFGPAGLLIIVSILVLRRGRTGQLGDLRRQIAPQPRYRRPPNLTNPQDSYRADQS